eukprot:6178465-Pleurochrysis_carterae.AAC.2
MLKTTFSVCGGVRSVTLQSLCTKVIAKVDLLWSIKGLVFTVTAGVAFRGTHAHEQLLGGTGVVLLDPPNCQTTASGRQHVTRLPARFKRAPRDSTAHVEKRQGLPYMNSWRGTMKTA